MITLEQINQIAVDNNITYQGYSEEEVITGSFTDSSVETINRVSGFIKKYLPNKIKTPNIKFTSYTLKHHFEKVIGHFYISNGEFIIAMIACGFTFKTNKFTPLNVNFNVPMKDYKALYNLVFPY